MPDPMSLPNLKTAKGNHLIKKVIIPATISIERIERLSMV